MHKLLVRQLRRQFGSLESVPKGMESLLAAVDASYSQADDDRALVQRSLELASQELLQQNARLASEIVERTSSEARKAAILESALDPIVTMDGEGLIQEFNPAAERVFGFKREEVVGRALADVIIPPAAREAHRKGLARFISTGNGPALGRRLEVTALRRGGEEFPVELAIAPVRMGDQMLFTGYLRDVTARKASERALRQSEERYRLIVETATEGIWQCDASGRTVYINEVMAEILGWPRDRLMGRNVFSFLPPEEVQADEAQLSALARGERVHTDLRFRRRDGSDLWALLSASPIFGADGSYQGYLAMITDITERKRGEQEMKESIERLQEVDRMRSRFLNTAAHELGTPLTPIRIQLQLVRARLESGDAEGSLRGMAIVDRNVDRLARLVKDMLDAARLQVGQLRLDRQPLDMRDAVVEAVETYRDVCRRLSITLTSDVDGDLRVTADSGRLGQVLDNLLSNASKFTPPGGSIHLRATHHAGSARVEVSDSGLGIPLEDQSKLFRPFSQVHDPMQHVQPGTGLGLYVSRGIVEAHGGEMGVSSTGLGKGTMFWFTVPLGPVVGPPRHQASYPSTAEASA